MSPETRKDMRSGFKVMEAVALGFAGGMATGNPITGLIVAFAIGIALRAREYQRRYAEPGEP